MGLTKAIVAWEPSQHQVIRLSMEEIEVDNPGEDEVFVEMRASGICHTDLALGSVPDGTFGIHYPKVIGHEGAGIARSVGSNVHNVKVGDPVLLSFYHCGSCTECKAMHPAYCEHFAANNYVGKQQSMTLRLTGEKLWSGFFGQSSFAHYSIVRKESIVNLKDLIFTEAELPLFAPLGCGLQTGMGAIQNTTNAGPEDVVMILGLGAVGIGAIMTAEIRNCKSIIAVDRIKSRLELAKSLGASHIIDTSSSGFSTLSEAVKGIFPSGVSIIIETTGVPTLLEQSMLSSKTRGKVVCIGIPPLNYLLGINITEHIGKGILLIGCIEGDCDPKKAIPQMIQWYREGRFPIDRLVQYFQATDHKKALEGMTDGSVIKPVLLWK